MADDKEKGFWDSASAWLPSAVQFGGGWYANNAALNESKDRAQQAQTPQFNQLGGAQSAEIARAGGLDPAAYYAQQQAIKAPQYDADQQALYRSLYQKGMLGLGTDTAAGVDPISGTKQTWAPGDRQNPLAAAFFAAQAGQKSKDAFDAIKASDTSRAQAYSNASTLGSARNTALNTGKAALPGVTKSGGLGTMFQNLSGMLGNKGVTDAIGGLFKGNSNAPGMLGAVKNVPGANAGQGQADTGQNAFEGGFPAMPQMPTFDFSNLSPGMSYGNPNEYDSWSGSSLFSGQGQGQDDGAYGGGGYGDDY